MGSDDFNYCLERFVAVKCNPVSQIDEAPDISAYKPNTQYRITLYYTHQDFIHFILGTYYLRRNLMLFIKWLCVCLSVIILHS